MSLKLHHLPLLLAPALLGSTGGSAAPASAELYTTAADTELRLTAESALAFTPHAQPLETEVCVFLNPKRQFQTFVGIGAALTDASAETFAKLPAEAQKEFLRAYFDRESGIGYTFARTNIASCDFSSGSYAYVADGDTSLKSFSVAHDEAFRIPFIKQAIAAAGGKLPLFASPWSPPAWMKDNKDVLRGGKLLPEFRAVWANHFVEFIKAYEARGIPIWGLTPQNEPMAKQKWESCIFTAEEERDFIRDHLGPTLARAGYGDRKLIAWDHNRDQIYQRASVLLEDPAAARYIWGIGFHWYETWAGGGMMFDNLHLVTESYPHVNLVFTEGCAESFKMERIHNWDLGERYADSMIEDFNAGTVAWCDWNILLDENGGPNHVGNFCFAPIHGDTRTGKLIYTNAYHYIGHFSKFIRPGARRIAASASRDVLKTTAFQNPNGEIVVVVLNRTTKAQPYKVWLDGRVVETTSRPRSLTTLVLK